MTNFECGVTEYVLIGKGSLKGLDSSIETTIYCTNVPVYVSIDEIQVLSKMAMDKGFIDFEISNIISEPIMVDDIDVEQSIFELRHTVDKESVDFTLNFTDLTGLEFIAGYKDPSQY